MLSYSSQPYYFLTEDETIQIGDTVIVPVGVSYELWEYYPSDENHYYIPPEFKSSSQTDTVTGSFVIAGESPGLNSGINGALAASGDSIQNKITVTNKYLLGQQVIFGKTDNKQSVNVGKTVNYTKLYYKADETSGEVTWVAEADRDTAATKVITDADGAASFDGIADGTYYLEEVKAPAGYNLLTAPVEVTVNGASATTTNLSALTVTKQIENNTGSLLPSTGGVGTTMMFIVGGALALGAAVLFVTKKRMSKNAD